MIVLEESIEECTVIACSKTGRCQHVTGCQVCMPKNFPGTSCDLSVFLHYFEACSIDSSKMSGDFFEVLSFNQLLLELIWFVCN